MSLCRKLPEKLLSLLFFLLFLFARPMVSEGAVLYVKNGGTGDGSSWAAAAGDLRTVLAGASSGDEIRVAAGSYKPHADDRGVSIVLKNGVALYGGFPDTGNPAMADRDPELYRTILTGDLLGNDIFDAANGGYQGGTGSDNSYHVVSADGVGSTAVLDGFFITGGNADVDGGGMYNTDSSPTVTNCTFSGNSAANSGGGMLNTGSSPTVTNCTFSGNIATNHGGGMSNWYSSPAVTNCVFSGNRTNDGGGMFNFGSSSPTVTNSTFSENIATSAGGGICNWYGSVTVTNCTFSGNAASDSGGGMYSFNSSPTVVNSIFWASSGGEIFDAGTSASSLTSCVVQGGYPGGTDILEGDPKLGPLADNGGPTQTHALTGGSSALDAGRPVGTVVSGAVTVPAADQRGISRPRGTGVDIGACEMAFGGLQVIIQPEAARTAGGKWSMDGGTTWKNSGETVENLLPGSYAVTFGDVTGWTKPAARTVDVAQGPAVPVTGTYVQQNPDPDPSPDNHKGGGCSAGGVFSPSVLLLLAPLALLAVGRTR